MSVFTRLKLALGTYLHIRNIPTHTSRYSFDELALFKNRFVVLFTYSLCVTDLM